MMCSTSYPASLSRRYNPSTPGGWWPSPGWEGTAVATQARPFAYTDRLRFRYDRIAQIDSYVLPSP